jgi:predicted lipid-binding transport protein (Tim44 family)
MKRFIVLMLVLSFGLIQVSEARRFGGARSAGFSKSVPTQTSGVAGKQQGAKKGGMLGGILAAGAIGAMLGYLFGTGGGFGILLLLVGLAALIWFMRRKAQQGAFNQNRQFGQQPNQQGFQSAGSSDYDNQKKGQKSDQVGFMQGFRSQESQSESDGRTIDQIAQSAPAFEAGKTLPDGTPTTVFEHQAQTLFSQLQELNTPESLKMVKGYLTPEFFAEIKEDILSNEGVAKFDTLSLRILDFSKEGGAWMGSVEIKGQVKEDEYSAWASFKEIWHYSRGKDEHIWRLAGIQQI